jgi:NOL1/NOP2/fmu family ribosome biogenesis protein
MCAAPGGKSTAIAASLKGEGLLVSNDISRSRAKALLRNLEGFGITNSIVTSEYPEKLSRYFPEFFDKVLIDAPCSGEGMFHKEPSMTESWLKMGPEAYHKLQKEILTYGACMVKPGGHLIYSTCTFSPEEDEGSIAWFLQEHPDFHLEKIDEETQLCGCHCIDHGHPEWGDGNPELAYTLRLWPHHLEGEGHFAAMLRRDGEPEIKKKKQAIQASGKKELEPFYQFLETEGIDNIFDKKRLVVQNGYVQYLPEEMPDLKGLHIMRSGWYLGEIKKNRFEPSGPFARGLTKDVCKKVITYEPESTQVIKYLKCETLEVDSTQKNGWYLVCVGDYPLGWGKVSNGTLKNKYPSGWRLV